MKRKKRNLVEVKNHEEEREVYKQAKKNETPVIYIDRTDEYAGCYYDIVLTLQCQLSDDARDEIQRLMDELIEKLERSHSRIYYSEGNTPHFASKTSGVIQNIPIVECRKIAKKIYDIIMDKSNLEPIDLKTFF